VSDQQEVWTAVAQLLRAQLTESVWFSTFSEVEPVVADGDRNLIIQVPSTLARDRILTRYLPLITDALAELGEGDRRFDVVITAPEPSSHVSDVTHGSTDTVDELADSAPSDSIIDAAGLKGLRVGGAVVSPKHANFFQAEPGATADDVYRLMQEVRRRVAETTGITLVPELRLVGFGDTP